MVRKETEGKCRESASFCKLGEIIKPMFHNKNTRGIYTFIVRKYNGGNAEERNVDVKDWFARGSELCSTEKMKRDSEMVQEGEGEATMVPKTDYFFFLPQNNMPMKEHSDVSGEWWEEVEQGRWDQVGRKYQFSKVKICMGKRLKKSATS